MGSASGGCKDVKNINGFGENWQDTGHKHVGIQGYTMNTSWTYFKSEIYLFERFVRISIVRWTNKTECIKLFYRLMSALFPGEKEA